MSVGFNFLGAKLGIFPPFQPFTRQQFSMLAVASASFTCMLITSLAGLPHVSVPTVVVFKGFATVVVAILDIVIFGNKITRQMGVALFVVALGAFIYGMYDITYNSVGYAWMILNMGLYISTQMLEKHSISSIGDQTGEGIAVIQNVYLMIIALCMFAATTGQETESRGEATPLVKFCIFMTGILGFMLNLAHIQLNKFEFVTSIALANWFSKVSSLLIGPVLFRDRVTLLQLIGALISMMGVAAYSDKVWSKLKAHLLISLFGAITIVGLTAAIVYFY